MTRGLLGRYTGASSKNKVGEKMASYVCDSRMLLLLNSGQAFCCLGIEIYTLLTSS